MLISDVELPQRPADVRAVRQLDQPSAYTSPSTTPASELDRLEVVHCAVYRSCRRLINGWLGVTERLQPPPPPTATTAATTAATAAQKRCFFMAVSSQVKSAPARRKLRRRFVSNWQTENLREPEVH